MWDVPRRSDCAFKAGSRLEGKPQRKTRAQREIVHGPLVRCGPVPVPVLCVLGDLCGFIPTCGLLRGLGWGRPRTRAFTCVEQRGQSPRLGPRKCEFLAGVLRLLRRFKRFRLIASGVRVGPQPDLREPGGLLMERRFSGVVALVETSLRDDDAWGRSIGRAEALRTLRNRGVLNSCEAAAATSRGRA